MQANLKILYVEDEPQLRMAMLEELVELGADVTPAEDGNAAIECLKTTQFDVVITDLRMPNLDGIGLRKKADTIPILKPKVWIALTAFSDQDPEEFKAFGFHEIFYKPFKPKLLIGMCLKLVGNKAA